MLSRLGASPLLRASIHWPVVMTAAKRACMTTRGIRCISSAGGAAGAIGVGERAGGVGERFHAEPQVRSVDGG